MKTTQVARLDGLPAGRVVGMPRVSQIATGHPTRTDSPTSTALSAYVARVTNVTTDARIAAVEDNLLAFLDTVSRVPIFVSEHLSDAMTYRSGLLHPLFNGVVGGRFAPGSEEQRSRDLIAQFVDRGLPFLWWSTPSAWSEGLDRALAEAGALRDDSPGMYADLMAPALEARPVDGLEISVVDADTEETMGRLMCEGFDMPATLVGPVRELFAGFDPNQLVNLLATRHGEPVACGSLWITGTTAGLYNIATLEPARGRGVGYAVTTALMEQARKRGCTEAILTATTMGRPVYERLGFVEVCQMPQYLWLPGT